MPYIPPRRVTSTPTTITVTGAVTTQLGAEAALTASNTFRQFGGANLKTNVAHPITGFMCDVQEDGHQTDGVQLYGYTGKGAYDPVSKQVIYMGSGYGGQIAGQYYRNTVARFRETANGNVGSWDAPQRGFLGAGDTDFANRRGMIHQYDSTCIDVASRRVFHKYGSYNLFFQYNIDTATIGPYINAPTDMDQGTYWWSAADVIPTRGTSGAMWVANAASGAPDGPYFKVWEYNFATQAWSTLFSAAALGNDVHDGNGPVMSYNPRAFGGAGGVMLGNNGHVWTINCQTLALTSVSNTPTGTIAITGAGSGFCRDPVGTGWLAIQRQARVVYRWNGSSWETRASWPTFNVDGGYVVIPIDAYGVVWMLSWESNSGYLYKP